MITKRGLFYLVCLLGFIILFSRFVPVVYDQSIYHINLVPAGNASDRAHAFIDYRRLTVYMIMWPVFCFLFYKVSAHVVVTTKKKEDEK